MDEDCPTCRGCGVIDDKGTDCPHCGGCGLVSFAVERRAEKFLKRMRYDDPIYLFIRKQIYGDSISPKMPERPKEWLINEDIGGGFAERKD